MVVFGRRGADGADDLGEMPRPAVRQVVAIDRGDDDVFEAELGDRVGDACAARPDRAAAASRCATLQKAQARVQISPMIIMVAWRLDQHSPILGQPASSHTVTSPCSRMILWVSP